MHIKTLEENPVVMMEPSFLTALEDPENIIMGKKIELLRFSAEKWFKGLNSKYKETLEILQFVSTYIYFCIYAGRCVYDFKKNCLILQCFFQYNINSM